MQRKGQKQDIISDLVNKHEPFPDNAERMAKSESDKGKDESYGDNKMKFNLNKSVLERNKLIESEAINNK